MRTKGEPIWDKDSKEAKYVRNFGKNRPYKSYKSHESHETNRTNTTYETYATYKPFIETRPPEVVANIIICLIHQTNYLLDRQLKQLEAAFLMEGGLRERMTRARLESRKKGQT